MQRIWLLLVPFLLAGCGGPTPPGPVQFGHLAPLSGLERLQGLQALRGLHLAVQQASEDLAKGAGRPVQVFHVDAGTKPETYEAEAVRLAVVNRVAGLLGGFTHEQAERIDREGLVLISPSGMRTDRLSKNALLLGLSPAVQGQAVARLVEQELVRAAAKFWQPELVARAFAPSWVPLGLGAVMAANVPPARVLVYVDERDRFRARAAEVMNQELQKQSTRYPAPHIQRLASADRPNTPSIPESAASYVVVLAAEAKLTQSVPLAALVPTVLFQLGPEIELERLAGEGQLPSEARFLISYHAEVDTPQNKAFVERYRKAYQETPGGVAGLMYDGAGMLFESVRQVESPFTTAQLRDKLAKLKDYPGLTGPVSVTEDFQVRRPLFVVRPGRDRLELVQRVEP